METGREIIREFDYSNIVPEIEMISFLVQYCDSCYKQLMKLCEDDAIRNEKLKYEFKEYRYKKAYSTNFEVTIREKNSGFSSLSSKTYESFIENVNSGHLNNVDSVIITLDLSFKRGKETDIKEYNNLFKISFKPYDIVFSHKSDYLDSDIEQIENNINEILKKFRIQNTVFCTK